MKVSESCPTLCDPIDCPWNSPGQNTGVGNESLRQGIFPAQESNRGLCGLVKVRAILQTSFLGRGGAWGLQTFCILSWQKGQESFLAGLGFF